MPENTSIKTILAAVQAAGPRALKAVEAAVFACERLMFADYDQNEGPAGPVPTWKELHELLGALAAWARKYAPESEPGLLTSYAEVVLQTYRAQRGEPVHWRPTAAEEEQRGRNAASALLSLRQRAKPVKRMSRKEANRRAMQLAQKLGAAFFILSENEQARQIGCAPETWRRTELYKAKGKRQTRQRHATGSKPAITLTNELGEQLPDPHTGRNTGLNHLIAKEEGTKTLDRLIAEQEQDDEGSPFDRSPARKKRNYKRI